MNDERKLSGETWFGTQRWRDEITPMPMVRVTDRFVTYLSHGREWREGKHTEHADWFPTFEEARQFLIRRFEAMEGAALKQAEKARASLAKVRALTSESQSPPISVRGPQGEH